MSASRYKVLGCWLPLVRTLETLQEELSLQADPVYGYLLLGQAWGVSNGTSSPSKTQHWGQALYLSQCTSFTSTARSKLQSMVEECRMQEGDPWVLSLQQLVSRLFRMFPPHSPATCTYIRTVYATLHTYSWCTADSYHNCHSHWLPHWHCVTVMNEEKLASTHDQGKGGKGKCQPFSLDAIMVTGML